MLKPHPLVLSKLLKRYESLEERARSEAGASPDVRRELQDTAYTLCVSTGTRDTESAKKVARSLLSESLEATVAVGRPAAEPKKRPTVAA